LIILDNININSDLIDEFRNKVNEGLFFVKNIEMLMEKAIGILFFSNGLDFSSFRRITKH
jgi:hypothetical protein